MRDNLEDVFLKPVHVRLFSLCMPDISDFAQTRRELNDDPLSLCLSSSSCGFQQALALDADQVRAFADRPLDLDYTLPEAKHNGEDATSEVVTLAHFVRCARLNRAAEGSPLVEEHEQPMLPHGEDVKCIDTGPILEGKMHAKLPFDDRVRPLGYFDKESAVSLTLLRVLMA